MTEDGYIFQCSVNNILLRIFQIHCTLNSRSTHFCLCLLFVDRYDDNSQSSGYVSTFDVTVELK